MIGQIVVEDSQEQQWTGMDIDGGGCVLPDDPAEDSSAETDAVSTGD